MLFLLRAGRSDPQWFCRARIGLSNVVVTPPVYKWLCCESLSRIFSEAYNVQLNTRFQGKWSEYQKQAEAASQIVFASGIGVVPKPLPRPGLPSITTGTGSLILQSLFVQTTWIDSLGQESAPSPVSAVILNGFSSVQVAMSEVSASIPQGAIGWNVYASDNQQTISRQNTSPLIIGSPWIMPQTTLIEGAALPSGQNPVTFVVSNQRWQRG